MKGNALVTTWAKLIPGFFRTRIEGRDNLQRIIANAGWLFADKIVRLGIGIIVTAWVARYLGPLQFGMYNFAIAFVALFAPLATLGLDNIVVRTIVRDPSHKEETLGTAFMLKAMGGILMPVIAVISISLLRPGDDLARWLVGITAAGIVFQAFDTIDFWFQSQVQSRYTVLARTGVFLIMSVIKVILILSQAPLIAFAWAGCAELVLAALVLMAAYLLNKQSIRSWRPDRTRAYELLRDSWPLIFAGLSIMIYMKIDQVMLGEMVGVKAVGIYSAATKVSEIWYFIPTVIVSSVFPSIVQIRSRDKDAYNRRLQKLFSFMAFLAFCVAAPMTFLSTPVVTLLFGTGFASAGPVLAIHIWASLFVFLGVAQGAWDLTENLTKLALVRTIGGALVNLALNFVLIPTYVATGAAIATVISYAFSAYFMNAFHPKTRPVFVWQTKALLWMNPFWSAV